MTNQPKKDKAGFEPHPDDLKALARRLYPAIRAYFESEEGQREFREWKRNKDKKHRRNKGSAVTD